MVNGATWEVTHIRDGGLWVRSEDRGRVYLPPAYLGERDDDGHTLLHAALQNPSSESVAALELVAGYKRDNTKQEAREHAEQEAALQVPTPDTTEHDIGDEQDAAFYDLIALGDAQLALEDLARFDQEEREAAAAKAEKEAREQAERERAEREAALAEAVSWVRGVSAGYNRLFANGWGVGDLPGGLESTRSEGGSSIIGC